ncbi:DUF4852 domain-containing protein [Henriciella litoralis]|uniref:DUF4852 domain-containing protein n=1 Tax=Henriciella litoralis TaxID=568102 RepID=UPI00146E5050|nr:DUF4852 domain-containing protein [Henriciella litoralis]
MLGNKNTSTKWKSKGLGVLALALASTLAISPTANAKEFTYDNLLYGWMKLDNYFDYDSNVDCYMRMYRYEVWQRSRDDEFLRDDKRNETIDIMKSRVGEANLEDVFTIRTNKDFGDYDFDTNKFEFSPISKTSYFYERKNNTCGLPSEIRVKFDNSDLIDGIAMSKDEAQEFLTSRKRNGDVDRSVALEIDFVLQARDGKMLQGHIVEARVLNTARYRDLDGRTLAEYTGSAPAATSSVAASPKSLSLFGIVPGGSLQSIKDELPRGSVVCNPAGGECEVHLKTGQKLVAKLDSSNTVTSLEHRVNAGSQSMSDTVDELKAVYGLPSGDTNQKPKAGGFSTFGSVPASQGQRKLTWRSDDNELQSIIFYGAGKPTEVVTSIRSR